MDRIHGMARALPNTSAVLIAGGIAIVGLPPFGLFVSEFYILMSAFAGYHYVLAASCFSRFRSASARCSTISSACSAANQSYPRSKKKLKATEIAAMCVCGACLLLLGLHIPSVFSSVLHKAMAVLQ